MFEAVLAVVKEDKVCHVQHLVGGNPFPPYTFLLFGAAQTLNCIPQAQPDDGSNNSLVPCSPTRLRSQVKSMMMPSSRHDVVSVLHAAAHSGSTEVFQEVLAAMEGTLKDEVSAIVER